MAITELHRFWITRRGVIHRAGNWDTSSRNWKMISKCGVTLDHDEAMTPTEYAKHTRCTTCDLPEVEPAYVWVR